MRILFSSDLHGDLDAYRRFAELLPNYDCGILAGDLLDEFLPVSDAARYGLFDPSEPEELHGDDYDEVAALDSTIRDALDNPRSVNRRGLERKRDEIIDILGRPGKPVFLVTGNHDIVEWRDRGTVSNIAGRRVDIGGLAVYGIKTGYDGVRGTFKYSRRLLRDVRRDTILVAHVPPYGILDRNERGESIGSEEVLKLARRAKPLFCLFGHVHEAFGFRGNMINGSWFLSRRFVGIDTSTREALIFS